MACQRSTTPSGQPEKPVESAPTVSKEDQSAKATEEPARTTEEVPKTTEAAVQQDCNGQGLKTTEATAKCCSSSKTAEEPTETTAHSDCDCPSTKTGEEPTKASESAAKGHCNGQTSTATESVDSDSDPDFDSDSDSEDERDNDDVEPETDDRSHEILRLYGFRADATSAELARLASEVSRYPGPYYFTYDEPKLTFEPFYFFFYGSLQYKPMLMALCNLADDEEPVMVAASIKGWRIMKWCQYPALVPDEKGEVKGVCWKCERAEDVARLRNYETMAYRMEHVKISTEDGEVIENGRCFVWAKNRGALREGSFDLEQWLEHSY